MDDPRIVVLPNGTVSHWAPPGATREVIFPEQELTINGHSKRRGGAFVCCPNFGPMPETRHYNGIELPQHGLVRNLHDDACAPRDVEDGMKTFAQFAEPWRHDVTITARLCEGGTLLKHQVVVAKPQGSGDMPLSFGFHPYFHTHGRKFTIRHNSRYIRSEDMPHNKPILIQKGGGGQMLELNVRGHGKILIGIGGYTHFCVWTDYAEKYLCVEPVRRGRDWAYQILKSGDVATGTCRIRFLPW